MLPCHRIHGADRGGFNHGKLRGIPEGNKNADDKDYDNEGSESSGNMTIRSKIMICTPSLISLATDHVCTDVPVGGELCMNLISDLKSASVHISCQLFGAVSQPFATSCICTAPIFDIAAHLCASVSLTFKGGFSQVA